MKKIFFTAIFILVGQNNDIFGALEKKEPKEYSELDIQKMKNEVCYHMLARMLNVQKLVERYGPSDLYYPSLTDKDLDNFKKISEMFIALKCLE